MASRDVSYTMSVWGSISQSLFVKVSPRSDTWWLYTDDGGFSHSLQYRFDHSSLWWTLEELQLKGTNSVHISVIEVHQQLWSHKSNRLFCASVLCQQPECRRSPRRRWWAWLAGGWRCPVAWRRSVRKEWTCAGGEESRRSSPATTPSSTPLEIRSYTGSHTGMTSQVQVVKQLLFTVYSWIYRRLSRSISFTVQITHHDVFCRYSSSSSSLTIINSRPSDSGFYHCRVQLPGLFNDQTSTVHLIIINRTFTAFIPRHKLPSSSRWAETLFCRLQLALWSLTPQTAGTLWPWTHHTQQVTLKCSSYQ